MEDEILVIYAGDVSKTLLDYTQANGGGYSEKEPGWSVAEVSTASTLGRSSVDLMLSPQSSQTTLHTRYDDQELEKEFKQTWGQHAEVYFTVPEYTRALLRYTDRPTVAVLASGKDPNCELLDFTLFAMSAAVSFVVIVKQPAPQQVAPPRTKSQKFKSGWSKLFGCGVRYRTETPALPCQVGLTRRYDNVLWAEPGERPAALDREMARARWDESHKADQWARKLGSRVAMLPDAKLPRLYPGNVDISELVNPSQLARIEQHVQSLSFDPFELDADGLVTAGYCLLRAVFRLPGLEKHALHDTQLVWFLMVLRSSYAVSTPYHNFSHVIDVLQATIYFMVRTEVLPPFSLLFGNDKAQLDHFYSNKAKLIPSVLKVASVCVAAPGHDLFHPGMNAKVLCGSDSKFKSLEDYHATLYIQMLEHLWPAMSQGEARDTIKTVILATDMAAHEDYMKDPVAVGPPGESASQYEQLLYLSRVLKAADLFNVVRPFDVSLKHAININKEFDYQSQTEQILGLSPQPKCGRLEPDLLQGGFKEPVPCRQRLRARQEFFTSVFARPFFHFMATDRRQDFVSQLLTESEAHWTKYWDDVEAGHVALTCSCQQV